jgi:hypothetical protein
MGRAGFVVDYFQNPVSGVRVSNCSTRAATTFSTKQISIWCYDLIHRVQRQARSYTVTRDLQSVSIEMYRDSAMSTLMFLGRKKEVAFQVSDDLVIIVSTYHFISGKRDSIEDKGLPAHNILKHGLELNSHFTSISH